MFVDRRYITDSWSVPANTDLISSGDTGLPESKVTVIFSWRFGLPLRTVFDI